MDEVKTEYLNVIKKLQVNSIVKPIPNPDLPLPEERKEKSLTIALVFISFLFFTNFTLLWPVFKKIFYF